jgi:hypothetical protein
MNLTRLLHFFPDNFFTALALSICFSLAVYLFALVRKQIKERIKFLVLGIWYHFSAFFTKTAAGRLSLRRYAAIQLAGVSRTLHVPGVREISLEIDEIYVPLMLEVSGSQNRYNHINLLSAGNRLQIIGDPGSGKSSIAKRVFRDECKLAQIKTGQARFPVLLELRKIPIRDKNPRAAEDLLIDYIKSEVKKIKIYQAVECFDAYRRRDES